MKRFILSLSLVLTAIAAVADKGTLVLRTPQEYQVMYISPNGRWAAGVYLDYSYEPYAFRMNLESGAIELLSTTEVSIPKGIANNGIVIGDYSSHDVSGNGAAVETPGYYDDRWHTLPIPGKFVSGESMGYAMGGGIAGGISPDGVWMTGASYINKKLHPIIWKNGEVYKDLFDPVKQEDVVPTCISPDGQTIAGWKYVVGDHYGVRFSFLQNVNDAEATLLSHYGTMFCSAKQFTSDGTKVLGWNGWNEFVVPGESDEELGDNVAEGEFCPTLNAVHDVLTRKPVTVITSPSQYVGFDVFNMSDDGFIVGEMSGEDGGNRAAFFIDGKPYYAIDWLKEHGIHDFYTDPCVLQPSDDIPYTQLTRAIGISADSKVMGFLHYTPEGYSQSTILLLDQELTHRAPCGLSAQSLRSEYKVRVQWKAPLSNAEGVQAYLVSRNGELVAEVPAGSLLYMDSDLPVGTYAYTVCARYADGTVSEPTEAATATVAEAEVQSPYGVFARQRGVGGARLQWHAPQTNHIVKSYFDGAQDNVEGLGCGDLSFEVGIRFDKEELQAYQGCQVKAVEFIPMSAQLAWTVNIYEIDERPEGNDTLLVCSQPVTQDLQLGQINTIPLTTPLNVSDLKRDIIVAVSPKVGSFTASYNVVGMTYGRCTPGYTDLIRRTEIVKEALSSIYDQSQASATTTELTWAINMIVSNDALGEDADLMAHYNIYADGQSAGTAADTYANIDRLGYGQHTLGVEAVYANGSRSALQTVEMTVQPDPEFYAVRELEISGTEGTTDVTFSWQPVEDRDTHVLAYCGANRSASAVKGNASENYALQARTIFLPALLRGYGGMKVTAFRFYPTCDAEFSFSLACNGLEVAYEECDDYKLNQWNEVKLEEPLTLVEGMQYEMTIDVYDATPGQSPLAIDDQIPFGGTSDLVATDGENFQSLSEIAVYGNWMMGLVVEAPDELPQPELAYNVVVDGLKANASPVEQTNYTHTLKNPAPTMRHTALVQTVFPGSDQLAQGTLYYFTLNQLTPVEAVEAVAPTAAAPVFDLQGRRIFQPRKGLYLQDGKKYFMK